MKTTRSHNIKYYVTKAYQSDYPLISKWHIESGSGLTRCVDRTIADFEEMPSLEFYVVKDDGYFVGYFATEFEGTYMPTVFIHPAYRSEKSKFWSEIEKKTEFTWKAGIYAKNVPCMKFYAKMGKLAFEADSPSGPVAVFQFERRV